MNDSTSPLPYSPSQQGEPIRVYDTPFTIYTLLADREARLSVPALAQLLQEVAEMHSTATGIGYHHLIREQRIWVLSRVSYRVLSRMPRLDERVRLRTWSKGCDGLMAQREFEVLSPMNEVLVAGTSLWVVLDMAQRKALRLRGGMMDSYPHHDQSALGFVSPKLRMPSALQEVRRFEVEHSSIDKAQHVNNAEYIRWMVNLLPAEVQRHALLSLDVNYLLETRPGETVSIAMQREEAAFWFPISNPRGLSVNAKMQMQ